jgi:hypothetical protein
LPPLDGDVDGLRRDKTVDIGLLFLPDSTIAGHGLFLEIGKPSRAGQEYVKHPIHRMRLSHELLGPDDDVDTGRPPAETLQLVLDEVMAIGWREATVEGCHPVLVGT